MSTTITPTPSTSAHRAFGNPAAVSDTPTPRWTRRGFLGALSAVTVATVSGCGIAGNDELDMGGGNGRGLGTGRGGGPATADGSPYTPTAPFALTSASELSEDWFVVANHTIDPRKDTVCAYTRSNGQVEAIVLQDGVVKQVYRDPNQPGGWAVYALADADDVTDMVAAATQPTRDNPYLKVCYVRASHPDKLVVATQPMTAIGTSGPKFSVTTVPWNAKALSLQATIATDYLFRNDDVLVWAMVPSSQDGEGDAQTCWHHALTATGTLQGFDYSPADDGQPALTLAICGYATGNVNAPAFFLYLPRGDDDMQIWCRTTVTAGPMQQLTKMQPTIPVPQPPPGDSLVITNVEWAVQQLRLELPSALVWTQKSRDGAIAGDPQLWLLTFDAVNSQRWVWTNLGLPQNVPHDFEIPVTTGLTPQARGGYLLDVFVGWGNTLSVARQLVASTSAPAFTPMITLQGDVRTMTSQAGATAGNQLIVVEPDGALHTLEKDANGGWSDNPVQVPATVAQQNSSYRVTMTLADTAWNAPVTGHDLTITATTLAVAIIEGPTPRTVQLGATPVTVTTDTTGEVTLALLADGLSAPTLTVTSDGLPKPATIYPSAAVNTYMQGGSTLNYLPTMNAGTLSDASTTAGSVVPKGTTDVAVQVDTMKLAATWGAQGSATNAVSSTFGRVDGGRIHGTRHQRRRSPQLSTKALGSNLDNWAHDVFHAVKKGVTSVEKVTVDAEKKIVTFAVDAAGWVNNEVQIVVHTIEDAAHVLHAAFNKLKADIWHAMKWLEAEVLGVFTSAKVLSDKFERWIGIFSSFAATTLTTDQTKVVNWLKGEQQWVTNEMTSLTGRFSGKTTLSNMAANPPSPSVTGSRPARSTSTSGPLRGSSDSPAPLHGDWFYRKIKHELTGSGLKIDLSNTSNLKDKLTAFGQKSLAHSMGFQDRFVTDFWKGFIDGVVHHPDDVDGVLIQPLLQALLKVVNDTFNYAENIVAEAFDLLHDIAASIPTLLSGTTLKDLPILGALMKLINLENVSIGRVANLIFAFPTALAYKIAHGAKAEPFAATAAKGSRGTVGDVASDLQICAASVMGTWAVFDTISAAFVAGDEDGGILFNAIDIAAPLIVTILTTPATRDGEPFFTPPVSGNVADILGFVAWVFGAIPALCAAIPLFIEKFVVDDKGSKDTVQATAWFQCATGIVALIFGMIANSKKDQPKGADYAGAVLNNMPTIAGAGLTTVLIDATVGISVVVAMALTLICGELGAAVFGVDG